jgi:hypothetical protein
MKGPSSLAHLYPLFASQLNENAPGDQNVTEQCFAAPHQEL